MEVLVVFLVNFYHCKINDLSIYVWKSLRPFVLSDAVVRHNYLATNERKLSV